MASAEQPIARAAEGVFKVGFPGGRTYQAPLPLNVNLVAHGDPSHRLSSYEVQVDSDAATDYGRSLRGLGWVLRKFGGGPYICESWTDSHVSGHNCAEISAIIGGLTRAHSEGFRRVLIRTDSRYATEVVTAQTNVVSTNTIRVARVLRSLLPMFEVVAIRQTRARELRQADWASRFFIGHIRSLAQPQGCYYMIDCRGGTAPAHVKPLPSLREWVNWGGRLP